MPENHSNKELISTSNLCKWWEVLLVWKKDKLPSALCERRTNYLQLCMKEGQITFSFVWKTDRLHSALYERRTNYLQLCVKEGQITFSFVWKKDKLPSALYERTDYIQLCVKEGQITFSFVWKDGLHSALCERRTNYLQLCQHLSNIYREAVSLCVCNVCEDSNPGLLSFPVAGICVSVPSERSPVCNLCD